MCSHNWTLNGLSVEMSNTSGKLCSSPMPD